MVFWAVNVVNPSVSVYKQLPVILHHLQIAHSHPGGIGLSKASDGQAQAQRGSLVWDGNDMHRMDVFNQQRIKKKKVEM